MQPDLVLGVDSSTQSTKAIAWTRAGEARAEGRAAIPLHAPEPGHAEQDVEDWWRACRAALGEVAEQVDAARIAGIGVSNQRETVAFLDAEGRAARPSIVWLDERAREEVAAFSEQVGRERIHRLTGKPVDQTPVVYRLAWLRRRWPEGLSAVDRILDVHGFLALRLTGNATASWTSADPFGLFDIEAKQWSEEILGVLALERRQFAPVAPPGAEIGRLTDRAAAETGLRPGTPVYAAGGDGQCAGLGVNAVQPGVVYLNLGTAVITGMWTREPRPRLDWRSMTSPTGEGYFLEGCQRAGTFLVDWFVDRFAGGRKSPEAFATLEREAARLPVGSEGVTVCPYLCGSMDPHWNPAARAGIEGLSPTHGVAHVYRAILEALTLESARTIAAFAREGLAPSRIVAVGGGARNRLWTQMLADATGLPVALSANPEASSLGAGMSAAVGCGWHETFAAAAAAMSGCGGTVAPSPGARELWAPVSRRQAAAYRA